MCICVNLLNSFSLMSVSTEWCWDVSRTGQGCLDKYLNSCIVYLICAMALLGFLSSGVLEISVEVMRRDACYRVISLAFKLCLW